MNFMYAKLIVFFCSGLIVSISGQALKAQTSDSQLNDLIKYPPRYLMADTVELGLEQNRWKTEQLQARQDVLRNQIETKRRDISRLEQEVESLHKQVPQEFRFATSDTRGAVVAQCLSELLASRLELATNEALHKQLESQQDDFDRQAAKLEVEKQQLEVNQQKMQVDYAKEKYMRFEQLRKNGTVSIQESTEAKQALLLAQSQLEKELLNLQLAQKQTEAQPNDQLLEVRREIAALKAREAAADRFLQSLNSAAKESRKLEQLQRSIDIENSELALLRKKLLTIQTEINDAQVFGGLAESRLKKLKEKQKEDGGDSDEQ